MPVSRVGDAQVFDFLISRGNRLRADLQTVQEQIASGRSSPVRADRARQGSGPACGSGSGAGRARRVHALGTAVLGAEDDPPGERRASSRAREIATQQATTLPPARRGAREARLIDAMTAPGNTEFAGRRAVFGDPAQDAPPAVWMRVARLTAATATSARSRSSPSKGTRPASASG
jgi:hypothetical protein